ncbi:MAG: DUF4239 domain-containing protein [Capsulimonadaceae bacterium]
MHTALIAATVVGLSVILSVAGMWMTRKAANPEHLRRHHDVAGFIIAILGAIYGVLQAFVVFVVYSQYDNARTAVELEANGVSDLYHMAYGFDPDTRQCIRDDIHVYVDSITEKEWPAMANGGSSVDSDRALDRLWSTYATIDPKTNRENALYQESISRLNDVGNNRHLRILAARDGLPGLIWLILICGSVGTVGFTYFFGAESARAQALMTALLTSEIALVLLLIWALQYPFRGDLAISSAAFHRAHAHMSSMETHEKEREVERKIKKAQKAAGGGGAATSPQVKWAPISPATAGAAP